MRTQWTQWADLFVNDETGYLDLDALHCAPGYWAQDASFWPTMYWDHRRWLDFKTGRAEIYCEPGYDPPGWDAGEPVNGFDQAAVVIKDADLAWPTTGETPQYPADGSNGPFFRGPSGTIGDVNICELNLQAWVYYYGQYCGMPQTLALQVLHQRRTRTYIHELGHVFGVNHHAPDSTAGPYNCVMKLMTDDDLPTDSVGWVQYTWGEGYLDDLWNCANEKGLRP